MCVARESVCVSACLARRDTPRPPRSPRGPWKVRIARPRSAWARHVARHVAGRGPGPGVVGLGPAAKDKDLLPGAACCGAEGADFPHVVVALPTGQPRRRRRHRRRRRRCPGPRTIPSARQRCRRTFGAQLPGRRAPRRRGVGATNPRRLPRRFGPPLPASCLCPAALRLQGVAAWPGFALEALFVFLLATRRCRVLFFEPGGTAARHARGATALAKCHVAPCRRSRRRAADNPKPSLPSAETAGRGLGVAASRVNRVKMPSPLAGLRTESSACYCGPNVLWVGCQWERG